MAPNMLEKIIMRKCDVTHKEAKLIVHKARENLDMSNESVLWSKELEAECIRVHHHQDHDNDNTQQHNTTTKATESDAAATVTTKDTKLKAKSVGSLNVKPRRCEYV